MKSNNKKVPGFSKFVKYNKESKHIEIILDDINIDSLKEIFATRIPKDREVLTSQYCKGVDRIVLRSSSNLNLCDDPECTGCQYLHRLMEEQVSAFMADELTSALILRNLK